MPATGSTCPYSILMNSSFLHLSPAPRLLTRLAHELMREQLHEDLDGQRAARLAEWEAGSEARAAAEQEAREKAQAEAQRAEKERALRKDMIAAYRCAARLSVHMGSGVACWCVPNACVTSAAPIRHSRQGQQGLSQASSRLVMLDSASPCPLRHLPTPHPPCLQFTSTCPPTHRTLDKHIQG